MALIDETLIIGVLLFLAIVYGIAGIGVIIDDMNLKKRQEKAKEFYQLKQRIKDEVLEELIKQLFGSQVL